MSNYNAPAKFHDLTGQRFGRLVVQSKICTNAKGNVEWLCLCDCGNETVATTVNLKRGHTKSCGCLQLEVRTKHGEHDSRLYGIWESMKQRCNNPNNSSYYNYGGRGITIYDEWNNYIYFRNWALNNGYQDNLTIDRYDNDLGYNPENCHWATILEQANNKRSNFMITYFDETHSLSDWCRILNLPYDIVYRRISRLNYDFWTAISTPLPAHYYNDCYDYDYSYEYYEDPYEYDNCDNYYIID